MANEGHFFFHEKTSDILWVEIINFLGQKKKKKFCSLKKKGLHIRMPKDGQLDGNNKTQFPGFYADKICPARPRFGLLKYTIICT
jgi:hypothetical protein